MNIRELFIEFSRRRDKFCMLCHEQPKETERGYCRECEDAVDGWAEAMAESIVEHSPIDWDLELKNLR